MPRSHSFQDTKNLSPLGSQVNEQLEKLERELDAIKQALPDASPDSAESRFSEYAGLRSRRIVTRVLAFRRARVTYFGADLFGEPAWDLLLELYLAELDHVRLSVSKACSRAYVPNSTAMRWITKLIESGLVRRYDDQFDQRRSFLALTDRGTAAMEDLINTHG